MMAMTTKSSIRVKPHTVGQAARQRHQCRADRTRPKLSDSGQEACRLEQEREGRVRCALGHGFMCRANNLIAVPCHAPAMPVCPTRAPVNPAFKIRIHDLKGTSQPIRPPRKRPPPNPNGFTHLLAQVALDPLPAQNHCQEYKHCCQRTSGENDFSRTRHLCAELLFGALGLWCRFIQSELKAADTSETNDRERQSPYLRRYPCRGACTTAALHTE